MDRDSQLYQLAYPQDGQQPPQKGLVATVKETLVGAKEGAERAIDPNGLTAEGRGAYGRELNDHLTKEQDALRRFAEQTGQDPQAVALSARTHGMTPGMDRNTAVPAPRPGQFR